MWNSDWLGHGPNRIVHDHAHLIQHKGRVLDLGCGNGRDSLYLRKAGFSVLAVDSNPDAARHTRHLLGSGATVAQIDARYLCLPDNAFDAVVLIGLIHNLEPTQADALCTRARNWLNPGGVLFMTAPLKGQGYACEYGPGELPKCFPGWTVELHEEKSGMTHEVILLVVRKPGNLVEDTGVRYNMVVDDDTLFVLTGDISEAEANTCRAIRDEAAGVTTPRVICDLSATCGARDSVVEMLVGIAADAHHRGGDLIAVGVPPEMVARMGAMQVDRYVMTADSISEAKAVRTPLHAPARD